ncbi:MAG: hypothetical protein IKM06_03595, partial [Clostridia bacterium]|nr:hypothetical protein [Clostridia bacterium]
MLLVCPCHRSEFLIKNGLGVEAHIGVSEKIEDWDRYIPFVKGIHLPYAHLNLAALDDELRKTSIIKVKEAIDEGAKYPVDRMVMHTMGIEVWGGGVIGSGLAALLVAGITFIPSLIILIVLLVVFALLMVGLTPD